MNFIKSLKKIINTGQSRSVIITGNVQDLFFDGNEYVPLTKFICSQCKVEKQEGIKGLTQVLFELNKPVNIVGDKVELENIWLKVFKKPLDERLKESESNATFALSFLQSLAECNRTIKSSTNNLLTIIEAADMLLPEEEISRMSLQDRKRIAIVKEWFSDTQFMGSGDSVVLIAESRSNIHSLISKLPQVLAVNIPLPDKDDREHFIKWFVEKKGLKLNQNPTVIAEQTSGLSIHAIRQLLLSEDVSLPSIAVKVEEYMVSQLGEGVVEFLRPQHKLDDLIGYTKLKRFLREELIPGFKDGSIGGCVMGGPIGGGKTHTCKAVCSELGIPVILLKNLRSQWYGGTDVITDRLERLIHSFYQIGIFIDEADTQFGGVEDGHETERRLTGKIQAMMSDQTLKGKVFWFLMTARIHRLSADIRREGRLDLIIPILDPEGDDKKEFIKWTFGDLKGEDGVLATEHKDVHSLIKNYSSASFDALRKRIKSKKPQTLKAAIKIAKDILQADIADTRHYQKLQALVNCTRRSLIFNDDATDEEVEKARKEWRDELNRLEGKA